MGAGVLAWEGLGHLGSSEVGEVLERLVWRMERHLRRSGPLRTFEDEGLVRITLKKAYTDGTIAVDMDPLSLLCRLATSVPPPRLHTIRYAGVLAEPVEATEVPRRSPGRGPPYGKSRVLRRQVLGEEDEGGAAGADEVA